MSVWKTLVHELVLHGCDSEFLWQKFPLTLLMSVWGEGEWWVVRRYGLLHFLSFSFLCNRVCSISPNLKFVRSDDAFVSPTSQLGSWIMDLAMFMHLHNPSLDFVEMVVSDHSYVILSDVHLIFLSFHLFWNFEVFLGFSYQLPELKSLKKMLGRYF